MTFTQTNKQKHTHTHTQRKKERCPHTYTVNLSYNVINGTKYCAVLTEEYNFFSYQWGIHALNLVNVCAEVILNSNIKHWTRPRQTRLLWTGPSTAKPRFASPNRQVRSAFF